MSHKYMMSVYVTDRKIANNVRMLLTYIQWPDRISSIQADEFVDR